MHSLFSIPLYLLASLFFLPSYSQLAKVRPNYDGTGNNVQNPSWGATGTPFGYFVGKNVNREPMTDISQQDIEANRTALPNARLVSLIVGKVPGALEPEAGPYSANKISDLTTYFGEFISQDLSHITPHREQADIKIPQQEGGIPGRAIPFIRANYTSQTTFTVTNPPASLNVHIPVTGATAFIDGSNIYGVDKVKLAARRDGYRFRMETVKFAGSVGNFTVAPGYLDYVKAQEFTVKNNLTDPNPLFLLGNIGGNTSPGSQSLHTLFLREHNRRAEEVKKENPGLTDDEVFEQARVWVISLIQKITISEYLPVILGYGLPPYKGYDPTVNPTMDSFFAAAAFRYGHSEVGPNVVQSSPIAREIIVHKIENVLMNTSLVRQNGIAPFLLGMTTETQQDPDVYMIRALRNFLFKGAPIDLLANDIQRTRDFALPSYVRSREILGLPIPKNFSDITSNPIIANNLRQAYGNDMSLIDSFIGGLAEDRASTSNVGPLFQSAIESQFRAVRDGDRFWYEADGVLPPKLLLQVKNTTMRDLMYRHLGDEFASRGKAFPQSALNFDVWHSTKTGVFNATKPNGFIPVISKPGFAVFSKLVEAGVLIDVQCFSLGGWCGFAFGSEMAKGEFIVGRPYKSGTGVTVSVKEYKSKGYATRPDERTGPPSINVTISEYLTEKSTLHFQFLRLKNAGPEFNSLVLNSQQFLFAFAPFIATMPTESSDWFVQHSLNHFKATINFFTGELTEDTLNGFTDAMLIHGVLMTLSFLLFLPVGIFVKRYFLSRAWTLAHIGVQSVATIIAFISFVYILVVRENRLQGDTVVKKIHSVVGFVLMGVLIITASIGLTSKLTSGENSRIPYKVRNILKAMHRNIARATFVIGIVQLFLGIYQYFPLDQFTSNAPYLGWWISFFITVFLWIGCFVAAEILIQHGYAEKLKSRAQARRQDTITKYKPELDEKSIEIIPDVRPYQPQINVPMNPVRNNTESTLVVKTDVNPSTWIQTTSPTFAVGIGPQNSLQHQAVAKRQMTWKSLNDAILAGECLVVGAGRYIYDISSWISSHPGGTTILNTVMGTDITNDFFNEIVSFDAEEFTPKAEIPQTHNATGSVDYQSTWISKLGTEAMFSPQMENISQAMSSRIPELKSPVLEKIDQLRQSFITKEDWRLIQKARRIHQHSSKAARKITSMLVGELVDGSGTPLPAVEPGNGKISPFDPNEYRRYALTSKKLVSSNTNKSTSPVYLCRFVLLYPFNSRQNEPDAEFYAGQSVEIQMQIESKTGGKPKIVSRFYTPISGTIKCFDVMIKVIPTGELTPIFEKADRTLLGVKQFKIRGPFGQPLVPYRVWTKEQIPAKLKMLSNIPLDHGLSTRKLTILGGWRDDCSTSEEVSKLSPKFLLSRWTRIIFIAAGSGLAPYLQIVRDHFLPENKVVYAYSDVKPRGSEELAISAGDGVMVMKHYLDGWAYGLNIRTKEEGPFPMSATVPLCGVKEMTGAKFRLINCVHSEADIFGEDILMGASYASTGGILKFTHIVTQPGKPETAEHLKGGSGSCQRNVITGRRIDIDIVEQILAEFNGGLEPHIIVCGPASFERDVYSLLVDEIGIEHRDITMLPPNSAV
ncbi:hypothetical protein HK098_006387 [Nowakowskiella sp. JEL0407]|nr:hypothetical protein HK098_006387 [Nowakowskiella sp. JEL0407]